ncbi:similar to Saccharomyces cerevisiae YGR234W YHB1 Nitric oxide oxidoreductase, flavohemoglobin involved in nitric oxide detoxification [Maudiozyma saulgeensis]|uniref:nitric oxide dioxygenase n=1 Tax=Maudiozyma saulgeensis TaxID=1789683 RepID=A0A1X7R9N2_9SACH|nr:similar to Saccharomyces cerevisiae YGR234W YHB1 Nitric oxide oxidoreductase, flavohemoglobin involved in nitric oxide detoxification [Kazachstania saulgeensis]
MLSPATRTIIKATVPILEQRGTEITTTFYKNMLSEHTELLNIFNRINQKKGAQPTALATTVLAAAKNIDDLSPLLGHVKQIGQKHRALQIKPEHYPIVGEYLLKAIKQVLGDAATPEIIEAWGEAYNEIANVFITVEKEMYKEAAWEAWKPFTVTSKQLVASDIYEFTVTADAGSGIDLAKLPIVAGQYITVNTHPTIQNNQYDALRHYSLCSVDPVNGLKFAVKLETSKGNPEGLVSEYLHDKVNVGDKIKLSAPAGDFALNEKLINQIEVPLVLLSAGVGVTPILAMLEQQINANPKRPIYWIQSSRDEKDQAFKAKVDELLAKCDNVTKEIVHTNKTDRINADFLEAKVPGHADVYICGSLDFMKGMIAHLKALEHNDDMIHYEPFGPKMSTVSV